jgi:hypothetical protein
MLSWPLTSVHAAARLGGLYCGRCAITRHAFELFTDGRDNAGSGDWVWQWVRFAKNEESLKAHLRIGFYTNCMCYYILFDSICTIRRLLRDGERSHPSDVRL